jgi:rhodanese-related sulfurtransferase
VKQLSVLDAPALLAEGAVYLDVRSTAEFNQGHPLGALNVPLFEPDEDTGAMEPNPDFVRVVQANIPSDATLLVGCQAGGRSMRAGSVLETYGYTTVYNVAGGYSGSRDPMGRIEPGWVDAGLPVTETAGEGRSYPELLANADAAE